MTAQREWFEKDYYATLGVSKDASQKDITKAYRKLARELHPDKNPGDAAAEERFKEVSAAYDVVGDDEKRSEYDQVRAAGPMGGFGGGGGFSGANFDDLGGMGGVGDLLGNLFGGGGRSRGQGPQRGTDQEAELTLSFVDAAHGVTTAVHLTSEAACSVCHGTRSAPGSSPARCGDCGGRGVLDDNQGFFSFSQPCPRCGGAGSIITDPCTNCRGTGAERRQREVKVRIPAGVDDGQRIRLKGKGGPGRNGGPAGDLFVIARVTPHALFGRKGKHLTLAVPVTFAEATLGADVKVPTLDGDAVTIRVPAGTASGKTFRVKNRGIISKSATGDLLVTVDVRVPAELSEEQRIAIEALAEATPDGVRDYLGV